jgi:hypothetical protein
MASDPGMSNRTGSIVISGERLPIHLRQHGDFRRKCNPVYFTVISKPGGLQLA